ncbi:MAG: hypothetical protein R3C68_18755 [Myxococcota bacterium]
MIRSSSAINCPDPESNIPEPTGVCPENYIVVNPESEHPDELTVVVEDNAGNPLRCARVALDLEAAGCRGTKEQSSLILLVVLLGFGMARRRVSLLLAQHRIIK